jgi:hypothetical protein
VIEVWRSADIVGRYQEYASIAERAYPDIRTIAQLGMIACAAAKTAIDIGPRFVTAPPEWGWPDAREKS